MAQEAAALWLNFVEFVQTHDDIGYTDLYSGRREASWLTHYISAWLEEGDAVIIAEGDFGMYMRGVTQIFMEWHFNNSMLDFRGTPGKEPFKRKVDAVAMHAFELDESPAFDPEHFKEVCARCGIRPRRP